MVGFVAIASPRGDIYGIDAVVILPRREPALRMRSADHANERGGRDECHFHFGFFFAFGFASWAADGASGSGNVSLAFRHFGTGRYRLRSDSIFFMKCGHIFLVKTFFCPSPKSSPTAPCGPRPNRSAGRIGKGLEDQRTHPKIDRPEVLLGFQLASLRV
jgi:hypothetical protein